MRENPRKREASFGEAKTGVEREAGGRFASVPKCDFCGKPITGEHYSDTRVCGGSDGPGFFLCDRKRCTDKRERYEQEQGLQALGEHYTAQRAANEGHTPNSPSRVPAKQLVVGDMTTVASNGGTRRRRINEVKPSRFMIEVHIEGKGTWHFKPDELVPVDREHTPNATIYGRRHTIRRGFLLVPQQMTGPGGKVYEVDLEYQVWDAETGAPVEDSRTVEGELHGSRLVVGDPHRDTQLFEYQVATQATSESTDHWRGYQAALGDRQWHLEGKSKKHYAKTRAWWDGYNQGHRDKRDPSAGYTPNDPDAGHTPNATVYYVWLLDRRDVPIDEGPYGPYNLTAAKDFARIGATQGDHDRAVSVGLDPDRPGFEIVRRYRRGTGEQVL